MSLPSFPKLNGSYWSLLLLKLSYSRWTEFPKLEGSYCKLLWSKLSRHRFYRLPKFDGNYWSLLLLKLSHFSLGRLPSSLGSLFIPFPRRSSSVCYVRLSQFSNWAAFTTVSCKNIYIFSTVSSLCPTPVWLWLLAVDLYSSYCFSVDYCNFSILAEVTASYSFILATLCYIFARIDALAVFNLSSIFYSSFDNFVLFISDYFWNSSSISLFNFFKASSSLLIYCLIKCLVFYAILFNF